MTDFFLNLSPPDVNRSTLSKLYLFMALTLLVVGGIGVYNTYAEHEQNLIAYLIPLLQVALAIAYLILAWRRKQPQGSRYVLVNDEHLELKLNPAQSALTLPWNTISLLRVQSNKLIYRLTSGSSAEVDLEEVPEQHQDTVRDIIRTAGREKGVSL